MGLHPSMEQKVIIYIIEIWVTNQCLRHEKGPSRNEENIQ